MRLNPSGRYIAGSALSLPFRDNSFDVVMASQMAHHLGSEDEVCRHFSEAWRVTRDLLLLNDLHRNVVLYCIVWVLVRLHGYPEHFCSDGVVSVLRSWRVGEWKVLAARAGIPNARVALYAGARVLLSARKTSGAV